MNDPSRTTKSVTLTRDQLANVLYSAVVQGRDSIHDMHSKMPVGMVLNRIAEGIADSVLAKQPDEPGAELVGKRVVCGDYTGTVLAVVDGAAWVRHDNCEIRSSHPLSFVKLAPPLTKAGSEPWGLAEFLNPPNGSEGEK